MFEFRLVELVLSELAIYLDELALALYLIEPDQADRLVGDCHLGVGSALIFDRFFDLDYSRQILLEWPSFVGRMLVDGV
jgi:hypothetical protein